MDDAVNDDNLLMGYLDGELASKEKREVESRLQSDEAFRSRYTDLQVAVQAIKHLGTLQQVQGVHREMMQEFKNNHPSVKIFPLRKIIRYTLAVAASVLIVFAGIRLYHSAQVSPDQLYNEAFVDYHVAASRGVNEELSDIESFYQQKEYSNITSSVPTLQLSGKDSLLIGLSHLHLNQYSSAARWFQLLASSKSEYRQDAEFYLLLSYLKTGEYQKALSLTEFIRNKASHLYHEQLPDGMVEKLRKLNKK